MTLINTTFHNPKSTRSQPMIFVPFEIQGTKITEDRHSSSCVFSAWEECNCKILQLQLFVEVQVLCRWLELHCPRTQKCVFCPQLPYLTCVTWCIFRTNILLDLQESRNDHFYHVKNNIVKNSLFTVIVH